MAKPTYQNSRHNRYRALTGGNANDFDLDRDIQDGVDWLNRKFNANVSSTDVLAYLREHPNIDSYKAAKRVYNLQKGNE